MKRDIDETARRFDDMSSTYDDTRSRRHRETADRVVELAREDASGDEVVVDVGAGTGGVALELAPHVERVVGLDISEGMLEEARRKARERGLGNVEFRRGRFRDLGVESADVVVSSFAMHHLDDREKRDAVEEIRRVLDGEGHVVIGDLLVFDGEVDAAYYDPEVDDPCEAEYLVRVFEDLGFEAHCERLGDMTGVVEAWL